VSLALYRKYRSNSFDQIVGQDHITNILKTAVDQSRFSHAYLFTGPRGVGKTSIARIMAYAINGLEYDNESSHLDIIEIDAASNNGVENIRDLREKASIAPVSAPKKIYIIDEVHMLSTSAFNALLKTLEEPPEHVIFILATTDAHKIPATIVSRTQRFTFKSVSKDELINHLKDISIQENINITDEALGMIADYGEGSVRDSISLLDQMSNLSAGKKPIDVNLVEKSLGLASKKIITSIVKAVNENDIQSIATIVSQAVDHGIDIVTLTKQLMNYLLELSNDNPSYLRLIDGLIEVSSSKYPNLKLISVLGSSIDLTKPVAEKPATKTSALQVDKKSDEIYTLAKKTKAPQQPKPKISSKFDLNALLKVTKKNHIAIHSVLVKCNLEMNDGVITIYCNNNFYKKKLDDSKYRLLLSQSLNEAEINFSDIVTIPSSKPIENSAISAIADIMGGGELVEVSTEMV